MQNISINGHCIITHGSLMGTEGKVIACNALENTVSVLLDDEMTTVIVRCNQIDQGLNTLYHAETLETGMTFENLKCPGTYATVHEFEDGEKSFFVDVLNGYTDTIGKNNFKVIESLDED